MGGKATCLECKRPYKIPPGADRGGANTIGVKRQTATETAQAKQIQALKQQLNEAENKADGKADGEPEEDSKRKVEKLKAAVAALKEANLPFADAEAKLKEASECKEKAPNLQAILKSHAAAEARSMQLARQVVLDEDRLANTKKRALDAFNTVAKLAAEKQRLLVEEGHVGDAKTTPFIAPAELPSSVSDEHRRQWQDLLEQTQATLKAQFEALVATIKPVGEDPPVAVPMEDGLGATAAGATAADGSAAKTRRGAEGIAIHAASGYPSTEAGHRAEALRKCEAEGNFKRVMDSEGKEMDLDRDDPGSDPSAQDMLDKQVAQAREELEAKAAAEQANKEDKASY